MDARPGLLGYGPEYTWWQNDVENCGRQMEDYWASKDESQRLVIMLMLFPDVRAHAECAHGARLWR